MTENKLLTKSFVQNENRDFFKLSLTFLVIFITANASSILTDNFILFVSLFISILFFLKKNKIDLIVIFVIFYFVLVNIVSFYYNNTSFNKITFIGFILKIIYPYFLLKLIGKQFFYKLENVVFILTLISIPIFIIQFFSPTLFYKLSPLFNFITRDIQKHRNGWYIIFYMFSSWFPDRNSGFMWEPGAFAFMILLSISIYLSRYDKIIINKRMVIYIVALLSTFSTMGYLGLFILLTVYFIQQKKILWIIFVLPLLFPFFKQILHASFLIPKLNLYFNTLGHYYYISNSSANYLKGSRFTYFLFAMRQAIIWPIGYGIIPSKNMLTSFYTEVNGVGTISKILIFWGGVGLGFFVLSLKKFYHSFYKKKILVLSMLIIMLIAFFSNPLEKSPILFMIVFYPYIYKDYKYANK